MHWAKLVNSQRQILYLWTLKKTPAPKKSVGAKTITNKMLRHFNLQLHESCQSIKKPFFVNFFALTSCFLSFKAYNQQPVFEIKLTQLEYVDGKTNQIVYLNEASVPSTLVLSRDYNHVYIELEKDSSIQYTYKVSGEAGLLDWKKTSNEIHLLGLGRGVHKLFVKGTRNGINSSNTIQFDVFVPSPIYLRWWFIVIIILIVVSIFYLFLMLEAKLLRERKDKNLQVSNLEAKAYRAQMNPHFIFNALNGMQSAMVLGGEQEFNKYITSFSKLIRNTIEMSSVDKISLADEIAYITNYIALQSLRLEKEIKMNLDVDASIDQQAAFLPCMMLQPIIENAIVHGIIPKKATGTITLAIKHVDDMLVISVTDDGIGRQAAAVLKERYQKTHQSFATQIMRDRIDIFNYYNKRKLAFQIADLHHDDGTAAGTKVTLNVPVDFKTRHK